MGIAKKVGKLISSAALAATMLTSQPNAKANDSVTNSRATQIQESARNAMRDEESSLLPAAEGMRFNMGNGVDDYIFNYLFRVSGRVRWAQTYPNSRFGHHRENSRDLEWRRHDSQHFSFFTTENRMLEQVVPLAEETYADYSQRMNVRTFNEKIRVHLFSDRIAFEQMGMWPGIVPEGLGGITEVMEKMHNKVIFLNEGENEFLYHVGRHELSHRFRMEQFRRLADDDMTTQLPLWFIEGIAEHDSLHMDPSIDSSIRDAYFNGFLELGISPMLQGTRFMYDAGTVYTNYIGDTFGEEALNRIVRNAGRGISFENNLRRVTGLTSEGLSRRVNESLATRYGNQFSRNGIEDDSRPLGDATVMAADENYFVLGMPESLQDSIVLARKVHGELVTKTLDSDRVPGSDSLHRFRSGADINNGQVAYVVRDGVNDIIRLRNFSFEDEEFNLQDEQELRFDDITFIKNPRLIDRTRIAFVGVNNGFMDLYLYDKGNEQLTRLTQNNRGIRGMDYNPSNNSVVFSLESEERTSNPSKCDFNYDLYEMDLDSLVKRRLTSTDFDETNPSVSPDGKRIAFNTDEHGSRDLALYDYSLSRTFNLPRSRIGASTPFWQTNNRIAFNTLNQMSQKALSFSVPSSLNLLRDVLSNESRPHRSSSAIGNIEFNNGRVSVLHDGIRYNINRIVNTDDSLYLASNGSNWQLFELENDQARPLIRRNTPNLEGLLRTNVHANAAYSRFYNQNSLLGSALSPDGRFIAMAVNNRLSFQDSDYSSDFPVSFYLYDINADSLARLPEINLDGVDNFESMHILSNGQMLIYTTESNFLASDDHNYQIYDSASNRLRNLDAALATVDRNKRFVLGVKKVNEHDRIFVYDSETGNTTFPSISVDGYSLLNITQTSQGDFLIREEGAHEDCRHYYVLNPETGDFRGRDYARSLPNRTISDMRVLPNGKLAIIAQPQVTVSTGIFYGEETTTDTTRSELYIRENGILNRQLRNYRRVNILTNDGNTLILQGENRNGSELVAFNGRAWKNFDVRDAEIDSSLEHLVFSDNRGIRIVDRVLQTTNEIRNTLGFDVSGTKLAYAVYQNGSFNVYEKDLETGRARRIAVTGLNEFQPRYGENGLVFRTERRPHRQTTSRPFGSYPSTDEGLAESEIHTAPFDYSLLTLMGVISNSGKFLITNFMSADMLEERILSLNYMGNMDDGYNFGNLSYYDLSRNYGVSSYIQQIGPTLITGANASLIFPQSRFSQFDLSLGYEFQDMDAFDFSGQNHVIKLGLGFGHDASLYGIHGPRDGNRLSAYTELGLSANHQTLSNADVYLAGRRYFHFCDFAYLALAGDVGTSQGMAPTLILNGGNMSLRGVSFGELLGNNVAMARSEVRLNIIDAAGVQFSEPITPFSMLTITPIPEIGWYNDIGATWYYNVMASDAANREIPYKLYYSGGPTLNITTFLGLTARFNFPVYGNAREWNFWLGYVGSNW